MQIVSVVVSVAVFAFIGLLPKIFFRKDGKYNLMWLVTAAPYFVSAAAVILSFLGINPLLVDLEGAVSVLAQSLGVLLSLAAFGLMGLTLGTHRIPLALWHQNNDAPRNIVTWGAYRYIRHPFYSSFLLTLIGAILIAPSIVTIACFVYGILMMNHTAKGEEARLSQSAFGAEYQAYVKKTGRFIPGL